MSPIYTYNGKLLVVDEKLATNENCCCAQCCLVGDGKGTIFLCGTGGDTCWGAQGNANIFFSFCDPNPNTPNTITIKGLGIIGQIDPPTIEANVKYNGELISLSANPQNCPINEAVIRTSKIDCVSIEAQGSRNNGNAQGWEHSPGQGGGEPCGGQIPGEVGGQGAYTITISDIDPAGDFLVYIKLGCNTSVPLFPNSPEGKNGTYFYVAGDNQDVSSTLNGNPVLLCGPEGRMIESDVLPNFGNNANWVVPADCIVWLVEGWIVSA